MSKFIPYTTRYTSIDLALYLFDYIIYSYRIPKGIILDREL
jgi:hypothetical protein